MLAKIFVWFDQRGTGKTKMRIHMNRLRDLVGIVAICATAALFTGCGGDDDDNGAPAQLAPDSLAGKTYNLTDAGEGGSIAFAADGSGYTLTRGAGAAE